MVGILTNETIKQKQQEIEVRALIALVQYSKVYRIDAIHKLKKIAFPDKVAEELEQETL